MLVYIFGVKHCVVDVTRESQTQAWQDREEHDKTEDPTLIVWKEKKRKDEIKKRKEKRRDKERGEIWKIVGVQEIKRREEEGERIK